MENYFFLIDYIKHILYVLKRTAQWDSNCCFMHPNHVEIDGKEKITI